MKWKFSDVTTLLNPLSEGLRPEEEFKLLAGFVGVLYALLSFPPCLPILFHKRAHSIYLNHYKLPQLLC